MGRKQSEYDRGRARGHKEANWNKKHPWATGAGGGYSKPRGKSAEYSRGYESGRNEAKKKGS